MTADAQTEHPSTPDLSPDHPQASTRKQKLLLMVGALAVVYGDIGTSPLYAVRECFTGRHQTAMTPDNILGIVSLIFWALILEVSIKYLTVTFRADNHGEGGILALLALNLTGKHSGKHKKLEHIAVLLGLLGTGLLYGDGVITPAISVLSAVEGLNTIAPNLESLVVPLTALILLALFTLQKRGTASVGSLFGPAIAIWFVSIAVIGIPWILKRPDILMAADPRHAIGFFLHNKLIGFLVLGAVMLCITGAEALYADMGHFGKGPIRITWYGVVLPALLLNYFGQGAYLLEMGQDGLANPFLEMAPHFFRVPLVIIATCATVIASQALISGAFSLTQQAIQLGYLPRMQIIHTSSKMIGQIYIPQVNVLLMVFSIALVLAFPSSPQLAEMYGIAVISTMTITSLLFFQAARNHLHWTKALAGLAVVGFLCVDLSFLVANLEKLVYGGWVPILLALAVFTIMLTWNRGMARLQSKIREGALPLQVFINEVETHPVYRVKGKAIFLTANQDITPSALLHHFKHNQVLHQTVIILSLVFERVPRVESQNAVEVMPLGAGFYKVIAHCGYMQNPDVPDILRLCADKGLAVDPAGASYYLGRETVILSSEPGMARWRKRLFLYLFTNARSVTPTFNLPPNRVIEIGAEIAF